MSSLKNNKTCALLEQYLSYLTVVKGRSPLTSYEYRVDTLMFFEYVKRIRGVPEKNITLPVHGERLNHYTFGLTSFVYSLAVAAFFHSEAAVNNSSTVISLYKSLCHFV